eukprot:396556-Rhodomonas_salina.1
MFSEDGTSTDVVAGAGPGPGPGLSPSAGAGWSARDWQTPSVVHPTSNRFRVPCIWFGVSTFTPTTSDSRRQRWSSHFTR